MTFLESKALPAIVVLHWAVGPIILKYTLHGNLCLFKKKNQIGKLLEYVLHEVNVDVTTQITATKEIEIFGNP